MLSNCKIFIFYNFGIKQTINNKKHTAVKQNLYQPIPSIGLAQTFIQ